MKSQVEIFVSYAHKDQRYREQLAAHLSQLKNEGLIDTWYDGQIVPGQQWADEIADHLESAQIVLLLISSDFLASDYCYNNEMHRAIQRHDAGEGGDGDVGAVERLTVGQADGVHVATDLGDVLRGVDLLVVDVDRGRGSHYEESIGIERWLGVF